VFTPFFIGYLVDLDVSKNGFLSEGSTDTFLSIGLVGSIEE